MPSAASAKPEKAPTAEAGGAPPPAAGAADNSPVRQILVIIEHKIRNLEKRKSKLTSYRDLQKSGKELNADQKVAVAKYDEVAQTLEFARDMCKQVAAVAAAAERDAKKQAKKDAWIRAAAETTRIRDVLLVQDCLVQMGSGPARDDFLQGANGAARLVQRDLDVLDELYPEVTPRHETNDEGGPAFQAQAAKAAEHLFSIVDGRSKEILGTTYSHIKQIVTSIHECGYFDKSPEVEQPVEVPEPEALAVPEEMERGAEVPPPPLAYAPPPHALPEPGPPPLPPAPAVVPAPAYPLRPLPPITLQEVEHAYFTQQYAQQRPITDVIGSQNFYFLQESEIDSPAGTPQPPARLSPPGPIPTQTFTNQNFVPMAGRVAPEPGVVPPQPHFPPPPPAELPTFAQAPLPPRALERLVPPPAPLHALHHESPPLAEEPTAPSPAPAPAPPQQEPDDGWSESLASQAVPQGEGDGQNSRYRKFRGPPRGQSNGFRGRGGYRGDGYRGDSYQGRQNSDGYQGRQNDGYQGRQNDGYQGRQNNGGYQGRSRDDYQGRRDDNRGPREDRGPRDDNRRPRDDNRGPREDRGPRDENRAPREDNRGPRDDNRGPREDNRGPRDDNRGPREDNRGPREDNRGPREDYRGPRNDNRGSRDDNRGPRDEQYRNGDNGHQNDNGGKYENYQGGYKGRGRGGGLRGGVRGGPPRSSRPPPHFARKEAQGVE